MSGRGQQRVRAGGVLRALLRSFLMAAVGFAIGLLVGIISEEPELLAGHLRGESTSVSLSAGLSQSGGQARVDPLAEGAAPRAVAESAPNRPPASPPPEKRISVPAQIAAQPARAVERSPDREAEPPKVSAAPLVRALVPETANAFAIQVGAFSDEDVAHGLARRLSEKGYPAAVLADSRDGGRWRVRVQPLSDEAVASSTAARLKRDEGLPTWVLRMDNDPGNGAR